MRTIGRILLTSLAVLAAGFFFPEEIILRDWTTAIIVAIVLALLNSFVKPLFILLTIPITLVTLGLFLFAVNAIMIELADWIIDEDFQVKNFWWSLVLSLAISLINSLARDDDKDDRKRSKFEVNN